MTARQQNVKELKQQDSKTARDREQRRESIIV